MRRIPFDKLLWLCPAKVSLIISPEKSALEDVRLQSGPRSALTWHHNLTAPLDGATIGLLVGEART